MGHATLRVRIGAFLALEVARMLVRTVSPAPPVFLKIRTRGSRRAPTPMHQPRKPFHALPDAPRHLRDGLRT